MPHRSVSPDSGSLFQQIDAELAGYRLFDATDELTEALDQAAGEVGKRLAHAAGHDQVLLATGADLRRLVAAVARAQERASVELSVALNLLGEGGAVA